MTKLQEVDIGTQPLERFREFIDPERLDGAIATAARLRDALKGRVVWHVNSTAVGGGVAEMLHVLLPYVRGCGIDARWLVLEGAEDFFVVTKRLHHALHGSVGDGSSLGEDARKIYERVVAENAEDLVARVRPGDVIILHDPQTAGLVPHMVDRGVITFWRCHVGADTRDEQTDLAWDLIGRYLDRAVANIFTRNQYIPDCCDHGRSVIIPPSIDPFAPKNQPLDDNVVRSILAATGIIADPPGDAEPSFRREDGSPGRVERQSVVDRHGAPPSWDNRLVVQVSRWDPLKDPVGVVRGFAEYLKSNASDVDTHLVLAGPDVKAIPDDIEQAQVYHDTSAAVKELPDGIRRRIHLACLPMEDLQENAAIVNALQTHASVVVQKSLREGFGLTVTEAMWKSRPVLASAVGGILDQIEDRVDGLLIKDATNPVEFASLLAILLQDEDRAAKMGAAARKRVSENYLGIHSLFAYAALIERFGE
ncbi:MAG: glycosyltransferase [Chloroflexi bacterium]|nr:glycosyltransferase [Chloroflexota bacterium]